MGQHRRLASDVKAAIGSFEHLVDGEPPQNLEALSKARVALVQSVNAYIAHLGAFVSGPVTEPRLLRWKEAHEHVVELRRSYSGHISRYSSATIKGDWPSYRTSSQRLMASMRGHLDQVITWEPLEG